MARRLSDEEQIEVIFNRLPQAQCVVMRERIDLQLRTRFSDLAPAKRGRKAKQKPKSALPLEVA